MGAHPDQPFIQDDRPILIRDDRGVRFWTDELRIAIDELETAVAQLSTFD